VSSSFSSTASVSKRVRRASLQDVQEAFGCVSLRKRERELRLVAGSDRCQSIPKSTRKAVSFDNERDMSCLRRRLQSEDPQASGVYDWEYSGSSDPFGRFNSLQMTRLMMAAREGNLEMIEKLLKNGADPMVQDSRDFDALMYAVRDGHALAVHLLLKAIKAHVTRNGSGNFSFSNPHGLNHMLYAALNGHVSCVEVLRRFGAQLDVPDTTGFTPIMAAVQNGHIETVFKLIELGADVNRADRKGVCFVPCARFPCSKS